LVDGKKESVEAARKELQPVADKEFNPDQDNQDVLFFYTGEVRCSDDNLSYSSLLYCVIFRILFTVIRVVQYNDVAM